MLQSSRVAVGREKIRPQNQGAILNAIHRHGVVSRNVLAKELQLHAATVTDLTGSLIRAGLVYEDRQGSSKTAGRKPILLAINYNYAHVIGIKVSNALVTAVLADLKSDVVATKTSSLTKYDPETVLQTVVDTVAKLTIHVDTQLVGLGLSLPGIVDYHNGTVRYSQLLGWENVPFAAMLEQQLDLPTLVENDVNALATAEAWFGFGKQHDDFLVVTLGRGVGLGIVLNGAVFRSKRGGAGEFGHTVLDRQGPHSAQAQRGSVEAYLSDQALLDQASVRVSDFPKAVTPETLLEYAQRGDQDALAIYAEAGDVLGLALSNLVNIFAPSLLILSGEGMRAAEFFVPSMRTSLAKHAFGNLEEGLEVAVEDWGDDAWARGAASMAASRFFSETGAFMGGDT